MKESSRHVYHFTHRPAYSSSSASSTVARGGRCTTELAGGTVSEPVGCGAEAAATGAGSVAGSGMGDAVPFFPLVDLPLVAAVAFAATLAAFFSFLARFLALMSSGVYHHQQQY